MELLLAEKKKYEEELKRIHTRIRDLEAKIKEMKQKQYPQCASCGRNVRGAWIATREDIEKYIDQNEGYGGPTEGELYCGC